MQSVKYKQDWNETEYIYSAAVLNKFKVLVLPFLCILVLLLHYISEANILFTLLDLISNSFRY